MQAARACRPFVTSLVLDSDLVPRMSLRSFQLLRARMVRPLNSNHRIEHGPTLFYSIRTYPTLYRTEYVRIQYSTVLNRYVFSRIRFQVTAFNYSRAAPPYATYRILRAGLGPGAANVAPILPAPPRAHGPPPQFKPSH